MKIGKNIKNELIKIIKIRFPPKLLQIRFIFKLTCYTFEGIDAIKEALINGKEIGKKNNISIIYKCLGAPEYECIIYTYNLFVNILLKTNQMYIKIRINKNEGILLMDESLNEVKNTILNKNGSYL